MITNELDNLNIGNTENIDLFQDINLNILTSTKLLKLKLKKMNIIHH